MGIFYSYVYVIMNIKNINILLINFECIFVIQMERSKDGVR